MKKTSIIEKVGIFSVSLLTACSAIYIYSPIIGSHADESARLRVNTTVRPVIALTLDTANLAFDITPTAAGVFESKSITATTETNSTGGYELYFSSIDNETSMANPLVSNVIASDFTGTVTSSSMAANKWGYSLDNTDFSKIPALNTQATIRNIDHYPSTAEKSTSVNIGVKINTSLPSGSYAKDLVFSVLAHATPNYNINRLVDLTSMQDPNLAQYCSDTYTPSKDSTTVTFNRLFEGDLVPRANLVDERDGNYYLVSKLADGNCWMSQNLALDFTAGEPIVASNNDGTTRSFIPTHTTQTDIGPNWGLNSSNTMSYHPKSDESYYQGGTSMSSTPSGDGISYNWEKTGNYYNYSAATASTGTTTLVSADAPSSICPKGWRLPLAEGNKSFDNLLVTIYKNKFSSSTIKGYPLNFVSPGWYDQGYNGGSVVHRGVRGIYRTSRAHDSSSDSAYELFIDGGSIASKGSTYKGYGYSIRCVAI